MFVLQSWSNSVAAVGHQGGRGPLSCVWGVAGLTWAGCNRRWQGDCCLPLDSVCICLCRCVCDWGFFACSNVLSWATPRLGGPVFQCVSCGCLGFLQQEHILADLIWHVEHSASGLKCVLDKLSGNEAYFFGLMFLDLFYYELYQTCQLSDVPPTIFFALLFAVCNLAQQTFAFFHRLSVNILLSLR